MAETGLDTPSLSVLIDRISSQLNTQLPGRDSRIRRSVLYVLARVWAGVAFLLYGFAQAIAQQILPDTANLEYLARHGSIWSIQRKLAEPAVGAAVFTGSNGTTIPAGTPFVRVDGVQYATDVDGTIASGTATIAATAVIPAAAGNTANGTIGALVSPIAGVASAVTLGEFAGGTDDESADLWRQRIIDRIRDITQGGSVADYRLWAESTAGVTVAKVFPLAHTPNAGDVAVYFLVAGSGAARIPSGGQVALVQAQLESLQPINDHAHAEAPADDATAITISGFTPNTPAMKAAVTAGVVALFDANATLGGTIANGLLQSAIGNTPGILTFILADVGGGGGDADAVASTYGVARLSTPIVWA